MRFGFLAELLQMHTVKINIYLKQDYLHSSMLLQTEKMKLKIIQEISSKSSRIRVIFATTALGMGVDTPHITDIVHITPPANMESYVQEIGRAGRTGKDATATLYYNNYDISTNKNIS